MSTICKTITAVVLALVMTAGSVNVSAQARRGGSSPSKSYSSSSSASSHSLSSTPSGSSSSVSRHSSATRQSSPQTNRSSSATRQSSTQANRSSSTTRQSTPSRSAQGTVRSGSSVSGRSSEGVARSGRRITPARPKASNAVPRNGMTPERMRERGPHPRQRDFIPYDRPGRFFGHAPHYFGYRVRTLHPGWTVIHYWGRPYYFYDNIYYRPWGDYYVVCRPPYGVYFHPTLLDVALHAVNFAYYCDMYRRWDTIDDNWETINRQNEIIAANNATIASQNAAIAGKAASQNAVAGEAYQLAARLGLVQSYADASVEYYYDDGVFFVLDSNGEYKVIVPPAGAIVETLPDDFEEVSLQGNDYYKVDDTIYRTIILEGKAFFEVLGQMQS